MSEELKRLSMAIDESNTQIENEIEDIRRNTERLGKRGASEDLLNLEKGFGLIDKKLKIVNELIKEVENEKRQVGKFKIDEAIGKYLMEHEGKIDLGKLKEAIYDYPISGNPLAQILGYESEAALVKNTLNDPIGSINMALLQVFNTWESGERDLLKVNINTVEMDRLFKEWWRKTVDPRPWDKELWNGKERFDIFIEVLNAQNVTIVATMVYVFKVPIYISNEIELKKTEYDDWVKKIADKENEYELIKVRNKKKEEELDEQYAGKKRQWIKDEQEANDKIDELMRRMKKLTEEFEDAEEEAEKHPQKRRPRTEGEWPDVKALS